MHDLGLPDGDARSLERLDTALDAVEGDGVARSGDDADVPVPALQEMLAHQPSPEPVVAGHRHVPGLAVVDEDLLDLGAAQLLVDPVVQGGVADDQAVHLAAEQHLHALQPPGAVRRGCW
ncbi:hypothetical protein LUX57_48915 [Actinomadura madurae]|nr:hypothetical protein [Actinomadura madurae]MCP9972039.1 hypothetical protein [Actinomadura madurae]